LRHVGWKAAGDHHDIQVRESAFGVLHQFQAGRSSGPAVRVHFTLLVALHHAKHRPRTWNGPGYGYYGAPAYYGGYAPAYYGGYSYYDDYAPVYPVYYGYRYRRVNRPAFAYYGGPRYYGGWHHGWHRHW
jgi:hypothetical protein